MRNSILINILFFLPFLAWSQFHGLPGNPGSNAIHKDSSIIKGWATSSMIKRGYMQINNHSLGFASVGNEQSAIGPADGNVVSLGDSGVITLQFSHPIVDGNGYDFVVFENSFLDNYVELAFVEISSDGINFFRFPSICNFDTTVQLGNGDFSDITKINNLAGKYRAPYGTPFDISDVNDNPLLDKNNITHIRLVDVIGSIDPLLGSRDSEGKIINDPFPTPFNSSGFDLDAVGVINYAIGFGLDSDSLNAIKFYPNPTKSYLYVENINLGSKIDLFNLSGKLIISEKVTDKNFSINLENLAQGIYILKAENLCSKIIKL